MGHILEFGRQPSINLVDLKLTPKRKHRGWSWDVCEFWAGNERRWCCHALLLGDARGIQR